MMFICSLSSSDNYGSNLHSAGPPIVNYKSQAVGCANCFVIVELKCGGTRILYTKYCIHIEKAMHLICSPAFLNKRQKGWGLRVVKELINKAILPPSTSSRSDR